MNKNNDINEQKHKDNHTVDEAGKDSFPASDAPSWTSGREEKKKDKEDTPKPK